MVGGVGLNFNAPLTGIDSDMTGHKALGKRLLKEVVSSLLSTPVPQNCPKKSSTFTFFHVFFNVTKLKPTHDDQPGVGLHAVPIYHYGHPYTTTDTIIYTGVDTRQLVSRIYKQEVKPRGRARTFVWATWARRENRAQRGTAPRAGFF